MSKLILSTVALLTAAGSAGAAILPTTDVGHYRFGLDGTMVGRVNDSVGDRVVSRTYDNWTTPGTALQGVLPVGLNTLNGDDLSLVGPIGAGRLSTMGLSLGNGNAAGTTGVFSAVNYTVNFFRQSDLVNIGGFTASSNLSTLAGGGLAAGQSIRVSFAANALTGLNILLVDNVFATVTFTAVTATLDSDPNQVAIQIRNPPIIGTSRDELVLNGTVTTSPFTGNPVGNSSFFVDTDTIPAPGAAALLGLGGLLAARRRR